MKQRLSLRGRALQLLAQRDHSQLELKRKLTAYAAAGDTPDVEARRHDAAGGDGSTVASRVDELLAWIESNRLSSDERFAEGRVNARSARFGNLRIQGELSQHGVALSRDQLQQLHDSELQRALDVWSRKFGVAPDGAALFARQTRFLAGRGFSPDVIRQVMREVARRPVSPSTPSPG